MSSLTAVKAPVIGTFPKKFEGEELGLDAVIDSVNKLIEQVNAAVRKVVSTEPPDVLPSEKAKAMLVHRDAIYAAKKLFPEARNAINVFIERWLKAVISFANEAEERREKLVSHKMETLFREFGAGGGHGHIYMPMSTSAPDVRELESWGNKFKIGSDVPPAIRPVTNGIKAVEQFLSAQES